MWLRLPALVVACVLLLPAASADWASFHADSFNSGNVDSTHQVYEGLWWGSKGAAGKEIEASPVVKDGRLISVDMGGNVRALDAQSGFEFWRYKMPGSIAATPAIAGDQVFVVDVKGNLKSLNLGDGKVEHEATAAAARGAIAEHEGKIFFGTETGQVRAYLSDLTPLWIFETKQVFLAKVPNSNDCDEDSDLSPRPIRGKPAVYDGKVFFGSHNHYLMAVSEAGNGDLTTDIQWISETGDVIEGAPAIGAASGQAYLVVGSYDGKVYGFLPTHAGEGSDACWGLKANPAWTYQVPSVQGTNQVSRVHSSPAISGGKAFVGANNGHVYAIWANNGTRIWEQTAGNEILKVTGSPALSNNLVVVGSEDKKVYWLNAGNGAIIKTYSTQSAIKASPAIDGDKAFVASLDGTWYAFGPPVPDRPDLIVTSIEAKANKVTVVVANQGKAASGPTELRFFQRGGLLFTIPVEGLAVAGTKSMSYGNFTPIPKGDKVELRAFVDPLNAVQESDESNNALNLTTKIDVVKATPTPRATSSTSSGKAPGLGIAVPVAIAALAVLLRRRIR